MKNVILGILVVFILICIVGPFPIRRDDSQTVGDASLSPDVFGGEVPAGLVLLKFGATWCPPCRMVDGELTSLGNSSLPLEIRKIDVDEHPDLADRYRVSSIPRLILFEDGREIGDLVGYRSVAELTDWVKESASAESISRSNSPSESDGPAAVHGNPYVE